ncbi:MAG: hypothetical protein ACM3KR_05270 [Deltaproteobacteria bacterium]
MDENERIKLQGEAQYLKSLEPERRERLIRNNPEYFKKVADVDPEIKTFMQGLNIEFGDNIETIYKSRDEDEEKKLRGQAEYLKSIEPEKQKIIIERNPEHFREMADIDPEIKAMMKSFGVEFGEDKKEASHQEISGQEVSNKEISNQEISEQEAPGNDGIANKSNEQKIQEVLKGKSIKEKLEEMIPEILAKEEHDFYDLVALNMYSEMMKQENSMANKTKNFFLKGVKRGKEYFEFQKGRITEFIKRIESSKTVKKIANFPNKCIGTIEKAEGLYDKAKESIDQIILGKQFNGLTKNGGFEMLEKEAEAPLSRSKACALYKTFEGKEEVNGKKQGNEYFLVLADVNSKTKFLKINGNLDAISKGTQDKEPQDNLKKFVEHLSKPHVKLALEKNNHDIGELSIDDNGNFVMGNKETQKSIEQGNTSRTRECASKAKEAAKNFGNCAKQTIIEMAKNESGYNR